MTMRIIAVAALLSATIAPNPAHFRVAATRLGQLSCGFTPPPRLAARRPTADTAMTIQWIGECRSGKATGLGMLRVRWGSVTGPAFYGRMHAGLAEIGVIEFPGGFVAGAGVRGEIIAAGEIPLRDMAFRTAAEAARTVARNYRGRKNEASARYYEQKAMELDQQIE